MNPEERSLFDRMYKVTVENNEILKSIRRTNRISMIVKTIYWGIIIGLSIGAFYFIQPYIDFMTNALGIGTANNTEPNILNTLQDLLK
ncbi:MAG: hypothetical protein AAB683_02005 [Patescibacteria group bacterium]|mgnify:CR=1 FL=1